MKKYKFISVEEQKFKIFELTTNKFFEELMNNKTISYQKLKELFYLVISTVEMKMKKNSKYDEYYKRDFFEMTNSLKTSNDFNEYAKVLVANDAKNLEIGLKATVNLSNFANQNRTPEHTKYLKGNYSYKLELPFYKKEDNKIIAIKFINTGFPNDVIEFNEELILTKTFFKKCTDEELDEIIVYDFKSMKRYIVEDIYEDFSNIFNILKIIDTRTIYANSNWKCSKCQHYLYCRDNKKYKKKSFEKIRKEYKDEKESKKLQQDSSGS